MGMQNGQLLKDLNPISWAKHAPLPFLSLPKSLLLCQHLFRDQQCWIDPDLLVTCRIVATHNKGLYDLIPINHLSSVGRSSLQLSKMVDGVLSEQSLFINPNLLLQVKSFLDIPKCTVYVYTHCFPLLFYNDTSVQQSPMYLSILFVHYLLRR